MNLFQFDKTKLLSPNLRQGVHLRPASPFLKLEQSQLVQQVTGQSNGLI